MKENNIIQAFIITGFVSIMGGVGLWGYQIYIWLRTGEWVAYSLLWPLYFIEDLQDWIDYPYEWTGVHKILEHIPFSIFLVSLGIILFFIAVEEN